MKIEHSAFLENSLICCVWLVGPMQILHEITHNKIKLYTVKKRYLKIIWSTHYKKRVWRSNVETKNQKKKLYISRETNAVRMNAGEYSGQQRTRFDNLSLQM